MTRSLSTKEADDQHVTRVNSRRKLCGRENRLEKISTHMPVKSVSVNAKGIPVSYFD